MRRRTPPPARSSAVRRLGAEQVDAAVQQAHDAFARWRARPIAERAKVATRIAELFAERREELAQLITREMGKLIERGPRRGRPVRQASSRYYADNAERLTADVPHEVDAGSAKVVTRPIGPLIGVMPWNFPYYQVARFAAPNIVLGNTILLKHAPHQPAVRARARVAVRRRRRPEGRLLEPLLRAPTRSSGSSRTRWSPARR